MTMVDMFHMLHMLMRPWRDLNSTCSNLQMCKLAIVVGTNTAVLMARTPEPAKLLCSVATLRHTVPAVHYEGSVPQAEKAPSALSNFNSECRQAMNP